MRASIRKDGKSVGGRPIKPPPVNWRPDLTGSDLAWAWKYAAGVNTDGSAKNADQHKCARCAINRNMKDTNGAYHAHVE